MTAAVLNGFFPSDFVAQGRFAVDVGAPPVEGFVPPRFPPVEIGDARALQAGAESEASFFAEHGFVLLPHASAVRDWDNDVARIYLPEVEAMIRERLLPGKRVEVQQRPSLLRRGRDTPMPYYANGVHSDFGLDAEDYATSIAGFAGDEPARWWRESYARDEVVGAMSIDFWRPTNMQGPLRHMPLALCDPGSVAMDDVIPTAMTGIAPEGRITHHLSLRYNEGQRFYFYPGMTGDEVLAFKLFECWKDAEPQLESCFHSAFEDPDAPADAEKRQSCEHRVGVMILRD